MSNFKSRKDLIKEKLGMKKDKFLHLMTDNIYAKKFINFVNNYFNKKQHRFIFITTGKLKYPYKYDNIIKTDRSKVKSYLEDFDKIFIHYLNYDKAWLVNNYKEIDKFHWVLWGADLYTFLDIDLYSDTTKKFIIEKNIEGITNLTDNCKNSNWQRETAMRKIPYILTNIKGDYQLVKSNYNPDARLIPFSYPNPVNFIELENRGSTPGKIDKYNFKNKFKHVIFIGNSGFATNNQIDILYYLKDIKSKDFCVVLPLSYGSENYIEKLIKEGKSLFGERFIPIEKYLKPVNYFYILTQVDVAIMNHKR